MLPVNEPLIKLTPIIKEIGNFIVWLKIKFTFLLSVLFCIPTISSKNKETLKVSAKIIFFNGIIITNLLNLNTYYKLCFLGFYSFLLSI